VPFVCRIMAETGNLAAIIAINAVENLSIFAINAVCYLQPTQRMDQWG
jgi:hypothetical protein